MIARFVTFIGAGIAAWGGGALMVDNWAGATASTSNALTDPQSAAWLAGFGLIGIAVALIAGLISVAQDMDRDR